MRAALWPAFVLLTPGAAGALECAAPDIARSYAEARTAADGQPMAVEGAFTPDGAPQPLPEGAGQVWNGTFSGRALGPGGAGPVFEGPATWLARCFGVWCGGPPPETPFIAFVEPAPDGVIIATGPCADVFDASAENRAKLQSCLAGGPCEPAPY